MAFNRWFRYPAGFSEESIAVCRQHLDLHEGSLLVDPFAGVATAGTLLGGEGVEFRGIEAHPMVAELANLKFGARRADCSLLEEARRVVSDAALGDADDEHPLVQRCFDAGTLKVLGGLRDRIARVEDAELRPLLEWALTATLRECASVKVGWPYQRPGVKRAPRVADPRERFLMRAGFMGADLATSGHVGRGRVVHGDSRSSEAWRDLMKGDLADACLTSPPYLNNYDYADSTRLELYFLGRASSWKEMTSTVRSNMMVASTQQTTEREAAAACRKLASLDGFGAVLDPLVERLRSERLKRDAGKQYDRMVLQYFADLSSIIENLSANMKRGGAVALVVGDSAPYGVYVDTPKLLGELAARFGMTLVADVTVRERGHRWANAPARHDVGLTERVIVLRNEDFGSTSEGVSQLADEVVRRVGDGARLEQHRPYAGQSC